MIIYTDLENEAGFLRKPCLSFPEIRVGSTSCSKCKYLRDQGKDIIKCMADGTNPLYLEMDILMYEIKRKK